MASFELANQGKARHGPKRQRGAGWERGVSGTGSGLAHWGQARQGEAGEARPWLAPDRTGLASIGRAGQARQVMARSGVATHRLGTASNGWVRLR